MPKKSSAIEACEADALMTRLMGFSAHFRGNQECEVYFAEPTNGANRTALQAEFLAKLAEHLDKSTVDQAFSEELFGVSPFGRAYLNVPGSAPPVRIKMSCEAYSLLNETEWFESMTLGGGALLQHGPTLMDYMGLDESQRGLDTILQDRSLIARHLQKNGLFNQGIWKGGLGRDTSPDRQECNKVVPVCKRLYAGAVEFRNWMGQACEVLAARPNPSERDFLELGIEGSLSIVRNQLFSEGNHRTSMSFIGLTMPQVVSDAWFAQVVDYKGSDGAFRSRLYDKMHVGWTVGGYVYKKFPPFESSGKKGWMSQAYVTEYRQMIESWIRDNGGAEWLRQQAPPTPQ